MAVAAAAAAGREHRRAARGAAARGRARRRGRASPCAAARPPRRRPPGGSSASSAAAEEDEQRAQALAARGERAARVRARAPAPWPSATSASRSSVRSSSRASRGPPAASTGAELAPCGGRHAPRSRRGCAMIPPAVSTQRTSVEARPPPARAASAVGPGEAAHRARQVACRRRGRPRARPSRGTTPVEPEPEEPGQRRPLRRRDLEHHHAAARAASRAPSRPGPRSRSAKLRAPKPTVTASNSPSAIRQLERVARLEAHVRAPSPARARASARRSRARPPRRGPRAAQLDRQVAGAGGHVERPRRPGPRAARSTARSRQRWCMPDRHDRVHPVVDAGDAVEHRPHLRLGRASRTRVLMSPRSLLVALERGDVLDELVELLRVRLAAASRTTASARSGSRSVRAIASRPSRSPISVRSGPSVLPFSPILWQPRQPDGGRDLLALLELRLRGQLDLGRRRRRARPSTVR